MSIHIQIITVIIIVAYPDGREMFRDPNTKLASYVCDIIGGYTPDEHNLVFCQ
jgi:hypothetical protein